VGGLVGSAWRFCAVVLVFLFFFSSRRRHTRSKRDWSSDVCSSDLPARLAAATAPHLRGGCGGQPCRCGPISVGHRACGVGENRQIGRASCRERGEMPGGERGPKKKREPGRAARSTRARRSRTATSC